MDPEPPPVRRALPGLHIAFLPDGRVGEASDGVLALEGPAGGRWADLSILETGSRTALRTALERPAAFELDLFLRTDAPATPRCLRCVGHWRGQRGGHLCQLADISDLRAATQPTADRLGLLQEMVDSLPLLIIELDAGPGLPCVFAGGTLLELVTPHSRDPLGRPAADLFAAALHDRLMALLAPGHGLPASPFTWHVTDAQGHERVLEGNLHTQTDSRGRPIGHLIDALETTAYHATMAELRATEDRLRRFVQASDDAVFICVDRLITDANPAACRLLGLPVEALHQRRFTDLLAPQDVPACVDRMSRSSAEAIDAHLVDGGGRPIAVEVICRHEQRRGRTVHMVIVRDVRDRVEAQMRIQALIADLRTQKDRAEAADRAKSLFLSAASHDLRQPIHAFGLLLTGLESLLQTAAPAPGTLGELAQRMGHSLETLSRLLNSLLDVSRLDAQAVAVHPMAVPLAPVFEELEDGMAEPARLKGLRLDVVTTDAWVHTDPVVLGRILENLVANAIRYTPRGRVLVVARPRGADVEIQVWDTGIGIAPDQLDAIFGEFYRVRQAAATGTEAPGLGLGLSIVQRSARLLGAGLRVRSVQGRGSMFSVRVPRAAPLPGPDTPARAGAPEPASGSRSAGAQRPRGILVIDDDAMVVVAMQQLLQAWGHEVWTASTADQAVAMAVSHADDIDLVLSDYHLGDDIDATHFIDGLRACLAHPVPVYVFTADTSTRVAREVQSRGLSMVHKPVREDALQQILREPMPWKD